MLDVLIACAKNSWRFESTKGSLSFEQLFQLPLTSKVNTANLDAVARAIAAELRSLGEDSFVDTSANSPARSLLNQKLELVKLVIKTKQDENEVKAKAASDRALRQKLLSKLEQKRDADLDNLSIEEIEARLKVVGV